MPLVVRPYQPSDGAPLQSRFSADARAPWLRLPSPYTVADLAGGDASLTVFVAEAGEDRLAGAVAIDRRPDPAMLIGPLVSDDQLADLFGRALVGAAIDWAGREGVPALRAKLDLGEERALAFFLNLGFRILDRREYVFVARKGRGQPPEPSDGLRVGPSPEMLSSEYQRLYTELGETLGWTERVGWTRPQIFDHLQRKDVHLYAARSGETYLGLLELATREPGTAEVTHFGVLPPFRRAGVGGALLDQALWHALEVIGYERVVLMATTDESGTLPLDPAKHGLRQERASVYMERGLLA